MDIFLCLVSYQYLASGYIQNVELPVAKARHENAEIEVVPLLLYPIDLEHDCEFLNKLNPLPRSGGTPIFRPRYRIRTKISLGLIPFVVEHACHASPEEGRD